MKHTGIRNNQRGMVAIITTLILMIVISLIVLGFSQVTRRNQRQALDAQLSSQAFYAAESGINRAKKVLKDNPNYAGRNTCQGADPTGTTNPITPATDFVVSASDKTAITCLLIQPVNNLVFDKVTSSSKVSLIQPQTGSPDTIVINWEKPNQTTVTGCTSGGTTLPQAGTWTDTYCNQSLLRIDLVPVTGSLTQAGLQASQYTAFLYPAASGGSPVVSDSWGNSAGASRGKIIRTQCNDTTPVDKVRKCMLKITDLPGGNKYAIRIMSLYGESNVEVHAKIGADQPNLVGAQTLVDSTAKANDVLKRVQARISTFNGNVIPDFAVMSDELCKRYRVSGSDVGVDGGADANACNL